MARREFLCLSDCHGAELHAGDGDLVDREDDERGLSAGNLLEVGAHPGEAEVVEVPVEDVERYA